MTGETIMLPLQQCVNKSKNAGFTLVELLIVVAMIAILATIAIPAMKNAPQKAKEAVLKEDLYQMRSCIDQHLADKGRYPASLQDLVDQGYLRSMPKDPMTGQADWVEIPATADDEEELRPLDDEGGGMGIIDVHSNSKDFALDGSLYEEW
jgi:general secretion pathway protein G